MEVVWEQLPVTKHVGVKPVKRQVGEDEGPVTAVITWQSGEEQKEVKSFFRLQPSPYYDWDIVQTSLMDDLLSELN